MDWKLTNLKEIMQGSGIHFHNIFHHFVCMKEHFASVFNKLKKDVKSSQIKYKISQSQSNCFNFHSCIPQNCCPLSYDAFVLDDENKRKGICCSLSSLNKSLLNEIENLEKIRLK